MRKFTKETQDLPWCYPGVGNINGITFYLPTPEQSFNEYEMQAEALFDAAHKGEETFTKDDLIDAFMKGTSVAHRTLGFDIYQQVIYRINTEKGFLDAIKKANEKRG